MTIWNYLLAEGYCIKDKPCKKRVNFDCLNCKYGCFGYLPLPEEEGFVYFCLNTKYISYLHQVWILMKYVHSKVSRVFSRMFQHIARWLLAGRLSKTRNSRR